MCHRTRWNFKKKTRSHLSNYYVHEKIRRFSLLGTSTTAFHTHTHTHAHTHAHTHIYRITRATRTESVVKSKILWYPFPFSFFPSFFLKNDTFRTRFHHWPSTKAGQTARNRATMQIADTRTRFSNIHLGVGVTPRRIKDDSRRNLGADWHARGLERVEAAARLERARERVDGAERASEREREREGSFLDCRKL